MSKSSILKKIGRLIEDNGLGIINIPPHKMTVSLTICDRKGRELSYNYKYSHLQLLLDYIATVRVRDLSISYNDHETDTPVRLDLSRFSTIEKLSLYNIAVSSLDAVLSRQSNITALELNTIEGTVRADTLSSLVRLTRLELSSITVLGTLDLSKCTALHTLVLNDCTRTGPILGGCRQLKYLSINSTMDCTVQSLDLSSCSLIEYLSVDGCLVEGPVPLWLTCLKSLRTLELTNCSITGSISTDLLQYFMYPNGTDSTPVDVHIEYSNTIDEETVQSNLQYIYYEDRAAVEIKGQTTLCIYPDTDAYSEYDY